MSEQLARHLAEHGWSVLVSVGLPHHPSGRLYPGMRWRVRRRVVDAGVTVVRSGHVLHPGRSVLVRSSVLASQALATGIGALADGPADVVLVVGPPLVGPLVGAAVAAIHGAKLVNVIYDIYPDVAVETGKLRRPSLIAAARLAERLQYRLSDRTIVLSEGFKRTMIAKGLPADSIRVVPVWLDPDEIRPGPRLNRWREEQGIPPEKRVVLYAGTIGLVSGAEVVAEAAARLRSRADVLFLFVGEGAVRDQVERSCRDAHLPNVRFLPFQPRERLPEVQATADIGLVTLAPGRGRTSVPSKVVGYMAAGRPVLAAVDADSDTAEEVRRSDGGRVVAPADPAALAATVEQMLADDDRLREQGTLARIHFERTYARDTVLAVYERALSDW
jgi:colanic acid biosynthesis glycosyl transferase WcaI